MTDGSALAVSVQVVQAAPEGPRALDVGAGGAYARSEAASASRSETGSM